MRYFFSFFKYLKFILVEILLLLKKKKFYTQNHLDYICYYPMKKLYFQIFLVTYQNSFHFSPSCMHTSNSLLKCDHLTLVNTPATREHKKQAVKRIRRQKSSDPRHAVADFDDGLIFTKIPNNTATSKVGGQDMLDLPVPSHAGNLLRWLQK